MKQNRKKAILMALVLGASVSLTNLFAETGSMDGAVKTEREAGRWSKLVILGFAVVLAACSRGRD